MNYVLPQRTRCLIPCFLLLFISLSGIAIAGQISGKVVGVSDGDTITVLQNNQQFKVRIYGVDCPESGQTSGRRAKEFTSSMVFGKKIEVTVLDVDKYGRSVGVVKVDGKTVNEALLKNGYAWLYTKYCDQSFCSKWKELEKQASERGIGLWADKNPMPPWELRKKQRGEQQAQPGAAVNLPEGSSGVFRGNAKSHVLHSPGCQHYNCKNCTETFKTVEESMKAGYHKHDQCVKR
ncbi:MAG: thermonuclease family protein [Desulfobulbaceae bacterium]|nr:thermonuclease family protein [Desulfobulbaceae bacterium]